MWLKQSEAKTPMYLWLNNEADALGTGVQPKEEIKSLICIWQKQQDTKAQCKCID